MLEEGAGRGSPGEGFHAGGGGRKRVCWGGVSCWRRGQEEGLLVRGFMEEEGAGRGSAGEGFHAGGGGRKRVCW
ncbi:hypothetical protein CesoFtcFv8_015767 [Champsocephalus esox]|uniref:Uncharacterized protein n=1 Tax=Champsocephalus esox TaxID=159716 RepID=A0AAN8BKT8_9TELE|nr:hypothetical protein CesoFtcFv8_015767 [Champsocephalus esox]